MHKGVRLESGEVFDVEMYQDLKAQEIEKIKELVGQDSFKNRRFDLAIQLFDDLVLSEDFEEFLTLSAYQYI